MTLTQALVLALTAPIDRQAALAAKLGDSFAASLTVSQVEACKAAAVEIAEAEMYAASLSGERKTARRR